VTAAPEAAPTQAEAAPSDSASTEDESANGDGEAVPGRRPRRRRRRGSGHTATGADEETDEQTPEPSENFGLDESAGTQESRNGYFDYPDTNFYHAETQPYSPSERGARERHATPEPSWNIGGAQPSQPARQAESPFGSPEPSYARGFGPQPRGVAGPAREPYTRTGRNERGADTPPMSSNVLASTVTHAIQQQTHRLLAELRHQSNPPAMTVMLPQLPSTERVGVFVDVANLLYSSRNLRVAIDFGRLLDFLRGNRRLIRAHAYAPTNPDPHAEQSFLSAVKGLGYRITTKNYKTFASGAKKADMDLDLCMDIVRLVDAGSLDTVVLVSGDSDFLPLLEYCSDHGVR
ncbi:MAG: NYN domain-containing protein, partial [Ktedonobacterales bacterium]